MKGEPQAGRVALQRVGLLGCLAVEVLRLQRAGLVVGAGGGGEAVAVAGDGPAVGRDLQRHKGKAERCLAGGKTVAASWSRSCGAGMKLLQRPSTAAPGNA